MAVNRIIKLLYQCEPKEKMKAVPRHKHGKYQILVTEQVISIKSVDIYGKI
jgi:hypothetical protein